MKVHRQLFATLLMPASLFVASCSPSDSSTDAQSPEAETLSAISAVTAVAAEGAISPAAITEAPAAFDNLSNGFLSAADFIAAEDVFEEVENPADNGLGPVFNNTSCVSCHEDPVPGTGSQISELRAGHFNGTNFVDHPGGSLINDRALDASIQEKILSGNEVRTFRLTLSIAGDGFVEAIDANVLNNLANAQPAAQKGTFIQVPVTEGGNVIRGARFGWKNQHASLQSFAIDAYLNEMGVTSPLSPTENTSNGNSVAAFDQKADPEDDGGDITFFTNFMRSLKAPPRGPITAAVTRGQTAFNNAGCATCHVGSFNTVTAGTVINNGTYTVPAAIGDKTIHPFGDFLLHDIGTGDGIVQNGGQATRNQVRTAPLWGLRARDRMMHDGASVTRTDAINRHKNQGQAAANAFNALSAGSQSDLLAFLDSL
jgi:CxxC motif-containing protein (DUF1111 family)